jgi:outer membrane protein OmpA-like peptidoglycan-associated protein
MKIRTLLLGAAASLALGSAANATTHDGWYVSLEGGASWVQDADLARLPATPFVMESDTGWAVLASVGYSWQNWRAEFEAGYRDNGISGFFTPAGAPVACAGCVDPSLVEITLMANVLYDLPLTDRLSLSIGAGAGGDYANLDLGPPFDEDDWVFAAQGIAGLNYAIGSKTDLFVTYRYLWVNEPEFVAASATGFAYDDFQKHTATIGLRYHFGAPAAEPTVAPPPPPPPPPAEPTTPREFIVFFGHNKSNLTSEALTVIKQAAAAAKEFGSATITVVGHADRSGSDKYNQKLSLRRGTTVKGALVAEGIADGSITVSAKGESDPMVPTADGVREPQNRRVHISL